MTDSAYEILVTAVALARELQIKTLSRLRRVLENRYPSRHKDIEEALSYWALEIRRRYPNGVTRD